VPVTRTSPATTGRLFVVALAVAWCAATFACDTDCGSDPEPPAQRTDPSITESAATDDAGADGPAPNPIQVSAADGSCSDESGEYEPEVVKEATAQVERMMKTAREVGAPRERFGRTWWSDMPVERCRHLVEIREDATHCAVREAARGRALLLETRVGVQHDGDAGATDATDSADNEGSNQTRQYIIGASEGPISLPADGTVQYLSVAPGLRYAVYDSVPPPDDTADGEDADGEEDGDERSADPVLRIDLHTGNSCRMSECLRPVVSPKDRWVVCRKPDGAVARFSLGGDDAEKYVEAAELLSTSTRDSSKSSDTGAFEPHDATTGSSPPIPATRAVSFPSIEILMVPDPDGANRTFSWPER